MDGSDGQASKLTTRLVTHRPVCSKQAGRVSQQLASLWATRVALSSHSHLDHTFFNTVHHIE